MDIEQAAHKLAEEARHKNVTVSEMFYKLFEKSEQFSDSKTEIVLRACEILEQKKP
jgi:hypothetical protein